MYGYIGQYMCARCDGTAQVVYPACVTIRFLCPKYIELECGPMPNVMDALPNTGGAAFSAAKFG